MRLCPICHIQLDNGYRGFVCLACEEIPELIHHPVIESPRKPFRFLPEPINIDAPFDFSK